MLQQFSRPYVVIMHDKVNLNVAINDNAIKIGVIRVIALLSTEDGTFGDVELSMNYNLSFTLANEIV